VAIACPYCAHAINLKAPKPGRFKPNCPKCDRPFVLIVSDQHDVTMQVRALAATTAPGQATIGQPQGFGEPPEPTDASGEFSLASGAHSDSNLFEFVEASPPVKPRYAAASDLPEPPLNADVRGYALERELGRGGMGTVYLARQLSLDRPVALKVMGKRWASDPVFVARFTREAYAAAQLSHPNIVQIHDIGEVDGTRFFSMEYVPGRTLAHLVKAEGKLDPETAVGFVLQAARGLKHAHDRGMIHRDVKPDNLLLDEQGLVKLADLGLVKTGSAERGARHETPEPKLDLSAVPRSALRVPSSDLTGVRIALGTPAYMSPEQCRDAAKVDHRADIYSLGCTLYVLITGRPPFEGTTALELMSKHAYDPLVPPEQIVARVPKEVSAVIQKMMAKDAADRYQTMAEVIRVLEAWLGVRTAGTFSPREEQIARLEGYVLQFNTAPTAVLRHRLLTGFFAALALVVVLVAFFGKPYWAFGLAGFGMQTALAYFVVDGVSRRGHLFTRSRRFVWGLAWSDWLIAAGSVALFCVLLAMLNVFWLWARFGLIGAGLAFGLRYGLDRAVEQERRGPVDGCERLLRRLRMQGLDEEELRLFVAKFSGRHWEAFFEALFGFEAKLSARAVLSLGGSAGVREKHAAWREPLIAWMELVEKNRREERERKLLEAVERAQLLAAGATPEAAEDKAQAAAEAMVRAAGQVRDAERQPSTAPVNVRAAVVAAEENPFDFAFVPTPRAPLTRLVGLFVGPHVRCIAAALLLAGCALWAYQNNPVPWAEVEAQATQAVESRDLTGLQEAATRDLDKPTHPLALPGILPTATAWVDGWNVGFAGLLLLVSLLFRGNLTAILALLGGAIAAAGHQFGIRTVEPLRAEHVAMTLGGVLALVGFRVGR
jgi:hypothetical protein